MKQIKSFCIACKENKPTAELYGEQICADCEGQIGMEHDRFDLMTMIHRRGVKWVMIELAKYDKNK